MTRELRVATATEILSDTRHESWVLKPFLVAGSGMMLYGRQGIGKSTLAMQLAAAFANGEEWLCFPTFAKGKTLWLQLDMPRAELRRLIVRSEKGKLFRNGTREQVMYANMTDGEHEAFDFNVFHDEDVQALLRIVEEKRPALLIVDTISDAYRLRAQRELNEQIRDVLKILRTVVSRVGAVMVYLNHERKRSQQTVGDDKDAFLSAVAFETFATASIQLTGSGKDEEQHFSLKFRKCRLDDPGFDKLELTKDSLGFFAPVFSASQAILTWPYSVPVSLRHTGGRDAVMDTIAAHLNFSRDALRQAWHRLKREPEWAMPSVTP